MEITKELLQLEIAKLQRLEAEHLANANSCAGAIQFCEQLVAKLDQDEQESAGITESES